MMYLVGLSREYALTEAVPLGDSLQIITKWHNGQPGCEKQYDAAESKVSIRVPLAGLNMDASQLGRFKALVQSVDWPCDEQFATITVGRYPFRAQNQQVALQILNDLVKESKTATWEVEDTTAAAATASRAKAPRRPKPSLEFPTAWLHPPGRPEAAGDDASA